MTDVDPSIPRIAIVLLAVVAVAVSAAGVPFDGQRERLGETDHQTPESPPETPEPPDPPSSPFGGLMGAVPYLFGGALGVLGLAAAIVMYRSVSGGEPRAADPGFGRDSQTSWDPEDLGPIADAAGRAAERIQHGGTLDNEVYRAWKEMTDHLGIANRRTRTAGEFATAAVRAGMDPEDVRELTTLFEAARYGTTDPTPTEERRAVELLRRIESKHGGDRE